MKKTLSLLAILFIICLQGQAQFTRYIIRFKDKGTNPFSLSNPSQYLSQRAIDRRIRYNIAIDSADLPVTPRYIDSVRLAGTVEILNSSKWLNQVAIRTNDAAALTKINSFPFVISTTGIAAKLQPFDVPVNKKLDIPCDVDINTAIASTNKPQNVDDYYSYGKSNGQVKIHNGHFLHNHGFRGEGMQMAVIDAGFFHYLTLPTFDSARNKGHILGTWDFVNKEASVDEDYVHGMQCLSAIAANMPGTFVGTAPETSFYLFRSEDINSEYPIEEQNLAAAAERSDSLGVDICSISLGYNQFDNAIFNYTYNDMNGNTSISARACDMAAKKGLLMTIAAGNEGNNGWHYLITPSDADSVLCVGAVDTTGQVGSFSSYGPSSDGQVKPSVAAVGWIAVVANSSTGQPSFGNGTSFATPNMAGITTCLWQAFPEINNMGIIEALELSANNYGSPDVRMGYGIPDAKKAFVILQKRSYIQQADADNCKTHIELSVKTDPTMSIVVERKAASEVNYTTVGTLQNTNAYGLHDFVLDDNLDGVAIGAVRYRFTMIISTDTTFYLDSVTVNNNAVCNAVSQNSIAIGPNPTPDDLNVIITRITDAKVNIVVQNALGQKVYATEFQQAIGVHTEIIKMKRMNKGAYFVTVFIDNKKELTKKVLRR